MGLKKTFIVMFLVFVAGIAFTGLINVAITQTNTLEFCSSCHSMQINVQEYKESVHYKNASGVRAICSDCHVPKEFIPKIIAKIVAAKDLYHEIAGTIDTPEKFNNERWNMANRVWDRMKASDSRECRTCHDFSQMDLSAQIRSARNRHGRAPDEGMTCIDCHKGIAHEEPDEPDTADASNQTSETDQLDNTDPGATTNQ